MTLYAILITVSTGRERVIPIVSIWAEVCNAIVSTGACLLPTETIISIFKRNNHKCYLATVPQLTQRFECHSTLAR